MCRRIQPSPTAKILEITIKHKINMKYIMSLGKDMEKDSSHTGAKASYNRLYIND